MNLNLIILHLFEHESYRYGFLGWKRDNHEAPWHYAEGENEQERHVHPVFYGERKAIFSVDDVTFLH